MDKQALLKKIQSYKFAAYDMLLFLDTHPDDKTAFNMYRELVACTKKSIAEYESLYGPLSAQAAANFDTFLWSKSPWPWEKEANE